MRLVCYSTQHCEITRHRWEFGGIPWKSIVDLYESCGEGRQELSSWTILPVMLLERCLSSAQGISSRRLSITSKILSERTTEPRLFLPSVDNNKSPVHIHRPSTDVSAFSSLTSSRYHIKCHFQLGCIGRPQWLDEFPLGGVVTPCNNHVIKTIR